MGKENSQEEDYWKRYDKFRKKREEETPAEAPEELPGELPEETPEETPEELPAETLKGIAETPVKSFEETPEETPEELSGGLEELDMESREGIRRVHKELAGLLEESDAVLEKLEGVLRNEGAGVGAEGGLDAGGGGVSPVAGVSGGVGGAAGSGGEVRVVLHVREGEYSPVGRFEFPSNDIVFELLSSSFPREKEYGFYHFSNILVSTSYSENVDKFLIEEAGRLGYVLKIERR